MSTGKGVPELSFAFLCPIKWFTALENRSLLRRLRHCLCNSMRAVFRYPIRPPFVQDRSLKALDIGYSLTDFVEKGDLLSNTFSVLQNDQR
ncbi:hypothetical protein GJ744_011574 [Endocarpon pusillum]|uniref:Uncharacterized protein n=1 Tax=Endocarpon pusillum TaxID=364733 RepID=A0A8H7AF28_9EURO|nr:hypothetical protein GJ744_011574 [Endocarpon pusillum]